MKIVICICPRCHRVLKHGVWSKLTHDNLEDFKNRSKDWEIHELKCFICKGGEDGD